MESFNKSFDGQIIDYLRDRPYSQEFAQVLEEKFSFFLAQEIIYFLKMTDFAVVKKILVRP